MSKTKEKIPTWLLLLWIGFLVFIVAYALSHI